MTNNQAIKIAVMMLEAASYYNTWVNFHPIVTRRDERNETYAAIAKALALLTGGDEEKFIESLEFCNGHNSFDIDFPQEKIEQLRGKYQNAPIYRDAKGRTYVMYEGVHTQDYCYQNIDVARYIDFTPTGKHRNIANLEKRLNAESCRSLLEALEYSGEINDISEDEYLSLLSGSLHR